MAQTEHGLSRRRACRLIGIARSVMERAPRRAQNEERLRERLRVLAGERRRFGYRRLHGLLRREGWRVNHKRIERLYREEMLAIRRRGRQKRGLGGPTAGGWCPTGMTTWDKGWLERKVPPCAPPRRRRFCRTAIPFSLDLLPL
jgi:transposase InsO family protein